MFTYDTHLYPDTIAVPDTLAHSSSLSVLGSGASGLVWYTRKSLASLLHSCIPDEESTDAISGTNASTSLSLMTTISACRDTW